MRIIKQSFRILKVDDNISEFIELCGRTCYKSEKNIDPSSSEKFVTQLVKSNHHSVLEHGSISVRFITDRAVTHELVRHRLASFSQESQRYVNYKTNIQFILPSWLPSNYLGVYKTLEDLQNSSFEDALGIKEKIEVASPWLQSMMNAESYYRRLIYKGLRPEQARTVLPNSTKTEIVVTANLREWRHIFNLRCSNKTYEQIRFLMIPLLFELHEKVLFIFDDIYAQYKNIHTSYIYNPKKCNKEN